MEVLVEILLQIVGEVLLNGAFDLIGEIFGGVFDRRAHALARVAGSLLFGLIFGYASVWLFPSGFLPTPALRLGYLLVMPPALGLAMVRLRGWLGRREGSADLTCFAMSAGFALVFALVRFEMIF